MSKQQNWNNLLRYVKRKVGSPLNFLELSDEDIYDIVIEDVLPSLSQYIGKPVWFKLGSQHIKPGTNTSENYYTSERYIIPLPKEMAIVEVIEVYWNQYGQAGSNHELGMAQGYISMLDPRDTVMANTFIDMVKSFDIVPTFRFIPPREILFDTSLKGKDIIIECKAEHSDLSTMPSDIYFEILRPMVHSEVLDAIVAMRKKYKSIATPFGQIELNWEELKSESDQIRSTIQEKLDSLPPEILISFID